MQDQELLRQIQEQLMQDQTESSKQLVDLHHKLEETQVLNKRKLFENLGNYCTHFSYSFAMLYDTAGPKRDPETLPLLLLVCFSVIVFCS